MTKTQQTLVDRIRRLHKERKPLNISAVKRKYPKLIEAVYKIKPFWGWKRALEDAGIEYRDIQISLQEYCICEICGNEYLNLGNHILFKHDTPFEEYLIDYPKSQSHSESLRAQLSKMKSKVLSHWEPLWTPEYVLDRTAEFYRKGLPVNHSSIWDNDSSLAFIGCQYFKSWDNVLVSAGIDPKEVRESATFSQRRYLNKKDVIRAIKMRAKQRRPLNPSAIQKGNDVDFALWDSALDYFGSWEKALKAAGFELANIKETLLLRRYTYPDRKSVLAGIRKRRKRKEPLHLTRLWEPGCHQDVPLITSAEQYCGSWNNALKAAGLNPDKIRMPGGPHKKYANKHAVVREIKTRHTGSLPLNSGAVTHGLHPDSALIKWATKLFGSWDKALISAELDPENIRGDIKGRRRRYPDKQSVIIAIRKRKRNKLPLNRIEVEKGVTRDNALPISAVEHYSSWDDALHAAGFDPQKIRLTRRNACSSSQQPRRPPSAKHPARAKYQ